MTTIDRRYRLLNILREQPGIRVPDLAKLLEVSEGTIRNDLDALSESGRLTRVWGGGIPVEEERGISSAYTIRGRMNEGAKKAIARMAAGLVADGDSVLLDASTTVFHMAGFLQERRNLTVITNGIDVGRELARNPSNTVMLLGGILRTDGTAITRPSSEQLLMDLHIKMAFMSSSGFSLDAGLTEVDLNEALFKRVMTASASQLIALIDSSKFGIVNLTSFARIEQISQLFTDNQITPEWSQELKQAGVRFILADQSPFSTPVKRKESNHSLESS
jgi:DeoR/GlpR family transcriptional regulator of sugar metabolism